MALDSSVDHLRSGPKRCDREAERWLWWERWERRGVQIVDRKSLYLDSRLQEISSSLSFAFNGGSKRTYFKAKAHCGNRWRSDTVDREAGGKHDNVDNAARRVPKRATSENRSHVVADENAIETNERQA